MGKQRKADPDAVAAIDPATEEGDADAGDGHAECAGIDREAHRGTADPEFLDQRRQDRLGGEQIDQRQERDQRDEAKRQPSAAASAEIVLGGLRTCSMPVMAIAPVSDEWFDVSGRRGRKRRCQRAGRAAHIDLCSCMAGGRMSAE